MGGVRLTHCRNQFAMLGFGVRAVLAAGVSGETSFTWPGSARRTTAGPSQEHRHDIEMKLIRQTSTQYLLDDADAAHHLNGLVPRGGRRLRDRRFDAVGDESEGQVLVLLRHDAGWSMRQHEDWHLELVVADEPVGILCHLERPPSHEYRACLCDEGIHVCRALKRREVGIETLYAAALVSDEPVDRGGHPDDHFCHESSALATRSCP